MTSSPAAAFCIMLRSGFCLASAALQDPGTDGAEQPEADGGSV